MNSTVPSAAYADGAACLRATILRYFGDPAARESCGACSTCDRRAPLDTAGRLFLRKILAGVARARGRYGARKVAAMLAGDVEGLPEPLTRLSTTGLLCHEHPRTIERWIEVACAAGLIRTTADRYRTLSLTERGRDVMTGRVGEVTLAVPVGRSPGGGRRVAVHRTRRRRRRP